MSSFTPNPKKRSYLLPPGCKDLIDVLMVLLTACGCAHVPRQLTLAHDIRVPEKWRGGTSDPVFRDSSDISRYISAYERGWWWCAAKHASDIEFQPESVCGYWAISGWPAATYGWSAGVDDAHERIGKLVRAYGKQRTSVFLADFKDAKLDDE